MKKQELQQFILEFQLVDQQLKMLQQQLIMLEQQAAEITSMIDNLEQLKSVKEKTKTFAQLGPGISIETTLDEPSRVLVNVGANIVVKKTLPETQDMLKSQIDEIKKMTENMQSEVQKLMAHGQYLRQEIQKMHQNE